MDGCCFSSVNSCMSTSIKYAFVRAMDMLTKELRAVDISDATMSPVPPKEDTLIPHSVTSVSVPEALPTDLRNILDWTADEVQQWLVEHGLLRMSRLITGCDGRSLIYLHRYLTQGGSQTVLPLLQDDSIATKRTRGLSLIELSCFHALIDSAKTVYAINSFQSIEQN